MVVKAYFAPYNHGVMVSWCHDTMVSLIQCFKDFMKNAIFAVFFVIFNNKVNGNSGDLIFARFDASIFVRIDKITNLLLFGFSEPMGCRFLPKFFYGLTR